MATPNEKLAVSLEVLMDLQKKSGRVAIRTSDLNRTHRERLLKNGFLKSVNKGWYIATDPNEQPGDTTSWYTSYWQFCSQFLEAKYGSDYCVSAEQTIFLYSGNNTVPTQLIVRAPKASNSNIELAFDTSIFAMSSPLPKLAELSEVNGIRALTLPSALVHCSASMYQSHPADMRTCLASIRDSSEVLTPLLEGSHTVIAGRLAGAFRNNGQGKIADDIIKVMTSFDHKVREADPFEGELPVELFLKARTPYVNRLHLMWHKMREVVIKHFPPPPGPLADPELYMDEVDKLYTLDAYHSLSIERYFVSVDLIERVRSGKWDILQSQDDQKQASVLAARGYWQAVQKVRSSIQSILYYDEDPGEVLYTDHEDWYRELFMPSVHAGLIQAKDLAGYRTAQVYISQSKYVPPSKEKILDSMFRFFELLQFEPHAGVRAVLGHFLFVYIHPFMDGNGRLGRFIMNFMLASGGYPWTVIPVEERSTYMNALEEASVNGNIEPFTKFIGHLVQESIKGRPVATLDWEY